MSARQTLRLGTRRSPLALHQAQLAQAAIRAARPDLTVELVEIVSDGDVDERELHEIGERGIFASALERQLTLGEIDAAVHSSKDLVLTPSEDLVLAAWLPRADPRDALVAATCDLAALPVGARIATGSARRCSALRTVRSDLVPVPVRGNVTTRIRRARARGDAGLLLAMAGLQRLGLLADPALAIRALSIDSFVPEAGQGAVVVQARAQLCDRTGFDWTSIDDVATRRAVQLERELARLLGGGCERPVGVHCSLQDGCLHGFWAPSPDVPGTRAMLELVELELATLVSVRAPRDVDDAAVWTARKLAPRLAELLGASIVEDA